MPCFDLGGPLLLVIVALTGAIAAPLGVSGMRGEFFVSDISVPTQHWVLLWAVILCAQGAIWMLSVAWLLRAPFWLETKLAGATITRPGARAWILEVVLPASLLACALVATERLPPPGSFPLQTVGGHPVPGLSAAAAVGFIVSVLFSGGLLFASATLRATFDGTGNWAPKLGTFVVLQGFMNRCLYGASMILGLGTVATAAIRGANNFPREYVIIYGATFTLALGLAYLAARRAFETVGNRILEEASGAPRPLDADWSAADWQEKREVLSSVMQLGFSGLGSFGPGVSTLVPLLLSIISALFPD